MKLNSEQNDQPILSSPNGSKPYVGSRIVGLYRITYKNGVVQEKNLISHSDYENIIKPYQEKIDDYEKDKLEEMANKLKEELKIMFGSEWFTDASPLFEASKTGILSLPKSQGGDHPCKVEAV